MKTKEIEIEAPWGKIAAKLWGEEENEAILVVHGLADNAGSFDRLIPLIPKHYFYICIDLPGHGKSTHFPPHLPIISINFLIVYTIVMNYFKREKYIIMGHSYGGQLGCLYTQLYPEKVEKLILIDTLILAPIPLKNYALYLTDRLEAYLNREEKLKYGKSPQYTYDECIKRIMEGRMLPITEDAAKVVVNRMLIQKDNGKYELSVDPRLKSFINPNHNVDYAIKTLKYYPLNCPILVIFGLGSKIPRRLSYKEIISVFKQQQNVIIKYVPGGHDPHLDYPNETADFINKFLNEKKSKL